MSNYPNQGGGYNNPAFPSGQTQGYPPQNPQYPRPDTQGGFGGQSYPQPSASAPSPAGSQWNPGQGQQFQGEMGEEDAAEGATSGPPTATAPPPPVDAQLPGYEAASFNETSAPPPSYDDIVAENAVIDAKKMGTITEEQSKEALLEYVSQQCCYGKGAVNEMVINDIQSTSAFHYTLETFTEGRSTKWAYSPFSGGFVDGPHMGAAPGPWDIQCQFASLFKAEKKVMEVPHTASIRPCHVCYGKGFNRCWHCHGRGRVRCSMCNGKGHRHQAGPNGDERVRCQMCHASGRKRCITCTGTGCVRCRDCHGYGQMKHYIQLTVTYSNRLSDHIVERTDMPDHLIRDVTGDVIFEQIAQRVGPVVNFMEQEINRRSNEIVSAHAHSWPTERVLQQRQVLRAVPVYECSFTHKEKRGRFWVYGNGHSVHTDDYPQTCCCCTIM